MSNELAERIARGLRSAGYFTDGSGEPMDGDHLWNVAAIIAKHLPQPAAGQPSYQRRLYDECVTAGWDSAQQNSFAEEIAHLHEELSEAFRAYRQHKDFAIRISDNGKLEGIPIEFADVLIGLFYNAELHGFDLFAAVEQKHQFNLSRNYQTEGRQLHAPPPSSVAARDTPQPIIEENTQ